MKSDFLPSGRLEVGCNYWASHTGTDMWREWDEAVVRADFKAMADAGMTVIRVFPNWRDFQPLVRLRGYSGNKRELCFPNDEPLPDTEAGRVGVDETMMARFATLCDIAAEFKCELIVALLTGWMSGRLFVPPAFETLDLVCDAEAIHYETIFIRYFVRQTKSKSAIRAWEYGNECNCLAPTPSGDATWLWLHSLAAAVRLEDDTRPIYSGMHGSSTIATDPWSAAMLAENCDALCVHPYPAFTPHCHHSAFTELPSVLHATAQGVLLSSATGAMCFVEEAGSLGPMFSSDERAAANLRVAALSAWAHDLRAYLWWCAFDQTALTQPPYEWNAMERELGLLNTNHQLKPTGMAMKQVAARLKKFPVLPPRKVHAVCVLTNPVRYDAWRDAFGAMVLAKRAGFELEFRQADQKLPDADFYIMPSIEDTEPIGRHRYYELLDKVKNGAFLLLTRSIGVVQPFSDVFGCKIDWTSDLPEKRSFTLDGERLTVPTPCTSRLIATNCEVLASDDDGNPIFTVARYGQGKAAFLDVPLESAAVYGAENWHLIYRKACVLAGVDLRLNNKPVEVGVTSHGEGSDEIAVLINYSSTPQVVDLPGAWLNLENGVAEKQATIPACDAVVYRTHGK